MTAIACYPQRENEQLYIWAVGDSRVTRKNGDGWSILHDHAIKIFSVPFTVVAPNKEGFFQQVVYHGSFGYCYSGSSLTGLNTYAAIANLIRKIATVDANRLPNLGDIASFIQKVLHRYILAYGVLAAEQAVCECSVLGYCPDSKRLRMFTIMPNIPNQYTFELLLEESDVAVDETLVLLGDKKDEIKDIIVDERSQHSIYSINWWRSPWRGIQRAIDSNAYDTIGGQIQLGLTNGRHFQIYGRMEPVAHGQPEARAEFLGLDVWNETQHIGPCFISLPLMAGLPSFE